MLARVRERVRRRRRLVYRMAPAFSAAAVLILTLVGLRYRTPEVSPPADRGAGQGAAGTDQITLLSNDPEMFDAVMERLSSLDVGGTVSPGGRRGDVRTPSRGEKTAREADSAPIWKEYQKRYFQGVRVESLWKELSEDEMDQVLQKIEERLKV
jgi:hypothetical protein